MYKFPYCPCRLAAAAVLVTPAEQFVVQTQLTQNATQLWQREGTAPTQIITVEYVEGVGALHVVKVAHYSLQQLLPINQRTR